MKSSPFEPMVAITAFEAVPVIALYTLQGKRRGSESMVLEKSIRLTEEDAAELQRYLALTGEAEATALKRAILRGLKDLRLEQGILAYLEGRGSTDAAEIAGLPRAEFLQVLIDKGITVLQGPSMLAVELDSLAERLGNDRLAAAADDLASTND